MVPGYHPAKVSGSVTVTGVAVLVNVSFSLTTYTVKFTETGLASGTSWSVTYNGVTQSAVKASISVTKVVNGTYSYTITPNAGYQTTSYPRLGHGGGRWPGNRCEHREGAVDRGEVCGEVRRDGTST